MRKLWPAWTDAASRVEKRARGGGLGRLVGAGVAGALLSTGAFAQCGVPPCGALETMVLCGHENGIQNWGGGVTGVLVSPNAWGGGNVPGDAEAKVTGCENGGTRGSGSSTLTAWDEYLRVYVPGTYTLCDIDLTPVVLDPGGVKVPDLSGATFG